MSAVQTLLAWFGAGWRAVYVVLLAYGAVVVVGCVLTRRWAACRDVVACVALVLLVGLPVGRSLSTSWPSLTERLWATLGDFPAFRLAAVVAG